MNPLFLSSLIWLCLICKSVQAIDERPFEGLSCYSPEAATLTSVFFQKEDKVQLEKIQVRKSRSADSLTFGLIPPLNPQLDQWYFLFAGVGSSADSAHALKLVRQLRDNGVENGLVIVPSVFRVEFLKSYSTTGLVGDIRRDARDLIIAIEQLKKKINRRHGFTIRKNAFIGYSLGALTAAHVTNWLESEVHHSFPAPEKVVLMNVPVNLFGALTNIDNLYQVQGSVRGAFIVAKNFVENIQTSADQENLHKTFCDLKALPTSDIYKEITKSLRFDLDRILLEGQQRTSTGFFSQRSRRFLGRREEDVRRIQQRRRAQQLTFSEYVEKVILPSNPGASLDELNHKTSVTSLRSLFRKNPRFYLIHSMDDFLISTPEELLNFKSDFLPQNVWLTQKGGHLGLLNSPLLGQKMADFLVD